jgi:hypothetical protein
MGSDCRIESPGFVKFKWIINASSSKEQKTITKQITVGTDIVSLALYELIFHSIDYV